MAERLFVGTRKGLFTLERDAGRWTIRDVRFLGEPVTMFLQDPRDGWLYASLTLGHFGVKLHRSSDEGRTWEECGVPVYPTGSIVNAGPPDENGVPPTKPASLTEIWALTPGGSDQPEFLWAGTIPGGLFCSRDRGTSWELVEALWQREERQRWFGGGKDEPGIHSVCVDPRDSKRITIGVSTGGVWVTEDGGASWECRGDGLRAEYMPPELAHDPVSQDVHRLAQCPAAPEHLWIQHHNGIFRSTDGARKWTEITGVRPSVFGFAVCAHPHEAQTAWFVPAVKDECRVPADGQLVVTRTRDGGRSFTSHGNGLPGRHCYDLIYRHALDVDRTGERLAMGSTTGGLWTSDNAGDDWTEVSHTLPPVYCVQFAR